MKKFLSLVLALVMTMSLVTISAGATDYKDLTDKSEIDYEEAVAVMNKIGIISGYEDGSFKPDGALTRGAGAKIIAYLMLGPTAAEQLGVVTAPYKDVAADNNFAPYIAYMKSTKLIDGYEDGTFRPSGALNGYAFSKMLLTALGYKSEYEGFTSSGWQTNVSRLAVKEGILRGNDAYIGSATVTRQEACLYAFNTLKATMVEYKGDTINVTTGDATVSVGNRTASYVENSIQRRDETYDNNPDKLTQFCEEKYPQLKLVDDGTTTDDFGRPSNKWAYKKVTIGTFPKTADLTYIDGASGDTNVDKVKDMGLKDYSFVRGASSGNSQLTVNGENRSTQLANGATTLTANANTLAKYAKNGAKVEIYLNDDDANVISHVAVIETQIMQINRVSSGDVTLKKVEDQGVANSDRAVAVNPVEDDDSLYNVLKDLKADDYVVVTPLWNGTTWDVDAVYIPTTATGNITKVKVNSRENNTSGLTVGGTDYSMSKNWTAEDAGDNRTGALNGTSVTTRQESTVYIDEYGYAIYVSNVKASTSYFMFDEYYASTVNGRIHYIAQGWDTKGNEVSLDFGTSQLSLTPGKVYAYKVASSNSNADYQLDTNKQAKVITKTSAILANDNGLFGNYFTSGVKFIFPTWEGTGANRQMTGATVKDGAQKVALSTYQYVLNDDNPAKIIAVFLADDTDVEVSQNVLYVQKQTAVTQDADGKDVSVFTGYIDGVKTTDLVANKKVSDNTFYTYKVDESTGIYTMNAYSSMTGKATSVVTNAWVNKAALASKAYIDAGNLYLNVTNTSTMANDGQTLDNNLNLTGATVIDLRNGGTLSSAKDMAEAPAGINSFNVSLVYNDSSASSNQGRVAYVFILDSSSGKLPTVTSKFDVTTSAAAAGKLLFSVDGGNTWKATVKAASNATVYVKAADSSLSVTTIDITTPNIAETAVAKMPGVFSFTMPSSDQNITAVTITGVKAVAAYIDSVGEFYIKVVGTVPSGDTLVEMAAKCLENMDYTDVKVQYNAVEAIGVTYEDNGRIRNISFSEIHADTAYYDFTVNGKVVVADTQWTLKGLAGELNVTSGDLIETKTDGTKTVHTDFANDDTNKIDNGCKYQIIPTSIAYNLGEVSNTGEQAVTATATDAVDLNVGGDQAIKLVNAEFAGVNTGALGGKKVTLMNITLPLGSTQAWIIQRNSALAAAASDPSVTGTVKSKTQVSYTGNYNMAFMVCDDGNPIVFEVYLNQTTNPTTADPVVQPSYTVTITTSGVTFAG